jgi:hypothetical protein
MRGAGPTTAAAAAAVVALTPRAAGRRSAPTLMPRGRVPHVWPTPARTSGVSSAPATFQCWKIAPQR